MEQKAMIYYYEVYYWDEFDEIRRTAKGVILGESMGTAVDKIVKRYGEDNVFDVKIYEMIGDEGNVDEPMEFRLYFDLTLEQEENIKPNLFAFH